MPELALHFLRSYILHVFEAHKLDLLPVLGTVNQKGRKRNEPVATFSTSAESRIHTYSPSPCFAGDPLWRK